MIVKSPYLIEPGSKFNIARHATSAESGQPDKDEAKQLTEQHLQRIDELQEVLYAEAKHAVLVVLQAIDAGGKDSTIRQIFEHLNPQGVSVASFKVPTPLERSHDYLWRYHQQCPPKGHITIFNRSHYESVLVERVKQIVSESVWRRRYAQINEFERTLASEGTTILKFLLHISKKEQADRFRDRLKEREKWWKFNPGDLEERRHWDDYQAAFEEAVAQCSTPWAPWYVIPADQKWYRNLHIAQVVRKTLEGLDLQYPQPAREVVQKVDEFLKLLEE